MSKRSSTDCIQVQDLVVGNKFKLWRINNEKETFLVVKNPYEDLIKITNPTDDEKYLLTVNLTTSELQLIAGCLLCFKVTR